MQVLHVVQAKVRDQLRGRMYVDVCITRHNMMALVDTCAKVNFKSGHGMHIRANVDASKRAVQGHKWRVGITPGGSHECSHSDGMDFIDYLEPIVVLSEDTMLVMQGDPQSNLTSATWDFIKSVTQGAASNPKVLLTHIPLYRPDETYCGPHRHSPVINQRISGAARDHSIIYQNYITEQTTKFLLDLLKPVLILSGHDHDQCIVTHSSSGPVKEHTLGTISWQQGNVYPSFMLMSVSNSFRPNGSNSEDLVSVIMTVIALLFRPSNTIQLLHNLVEYSRTLKSCNIFEAGGKEKVDENVAYEMVWDAEGSMHLVKKVQNVPLPRSAETRLVERGPAIMRPSARKHNDVEASFTADTVVDTHLDGEVKLSTKTSKPRKVLVCRRVFVTFQMLTVIAAVNVPLYMVLLFKDWIDQ
ncbi:hypothetical protein RJ641_019720 [Dillenia turbinata]|uniref:Calcineurin-like phosphoesterase domain-containing protein n=1 Tax=Dillenia turbinata TaxID=194707 RepID=A0AAN8UD42_9MAGN